MNVFSENINIKLLIPISNKLLKILLLHSRLESKFLRKVLIAFIFFFENVIVFIAER